MMAFLINPTLFNTSTFSKTFESGKDTPVSILFNLFIYTDCQSVLANYRKSSNMPPLLSYKPPSSNKPFPSFQGKKVNKSPFL